ncbi:MAG: metalloregulator ArsR/SmtB family transcription factor [Pseudomonadota bacterium]
MDTIFKALNDPTRRALLDALRKTDGQTLTDLEEQLDMTRFGVMKHLKVLEDAGLVVPVKRGRFKHHYLNAVPLQEVIDRWIEPLLAKPAARGLLTLKTDLERQSHMLDTTDTKPDFALQSFIGCTQDALWNALTDPAAMQTYHFMSERITKADDTYTYYFPDPKTPGLVCRTIEETPKTRLVLTFEPLWKGGGAPSRTVFRLDPQGDFCALTVEHYDLTFPVVPGEGVADGWARWAASLKTWLETGETPRFFNGL